MALNLEALVLECAKRLGIDPNNYVIQDSAPLPVTGLSGRLYGARTIPHVQEFVDKLTASERVMSTLPATGPVYVMNDDALFAATGDVRDVIQQNMNAIPFTLAGTNIYLKAATFWKNPATGNYEGGKQDEIPDTIVFPAGMRDSGVLAAIQERVKRDAHLDPDSSRFRRK